MVHSVGVCSWSLQPHSCAQLIESLRSLRIESVQLALDPIVNNDWDWEKTRDQLARAGITIRSGMITTIGEDYTTLESIRDTGGLRPDEHWESNRAHATKAAEIAAAMGIPLATLHAGFIPEADNKLRNIMIERIAEVAQIFDSQGIRLALETGQESADNLLKLLEHPSLQSVGVNFDPANMILYAMGDPIESMRTLADRIAQVHMKDALPSDSLGQWGMEVPAGQGIVDWRGFFRVLSSIDRPIDIMIERESGYDRVADIRAAHNLACKLGAIND
ncbi:MAG: sugar phosphate isomerase/epimerase [Phycisphaerales bacterium]|nr:sugar phosphate isomerase/epimerase [Phycisphaerales bacterium]